MNTGTPDRIGPFFNFASGRLVAGGNGFFAYNDPWKTPYAYFSSGKRRNNYNAYYNPAGSGAALASDCATLGVWPYIDPNSNYMNPDTYQIISAGSNQAFGQGSNLTLVPSGQSPAQQNLAWSSQGIPTNGGQTSKARLDLATQTNPVGLDDFSNFYDKALGISQ
jgi:hypothetical protein